MSPVFGRRRVPRSSLFIYTIVCAAVSSPSLEEMRTSHHQLALFFHPVLLL